MTEPFGHLLYGLSLENQGIPIMYKKPGRSASTFEENEGWQDWPPADSTDQLRAASEVRPNISANPTPVPAKRQNGLTWPVPDAANHTRPRRLTAKVVALVLGALLL